MILVPLILHQRLVVSFKKKCLWEHSFEGAAHLLHFSIKGNVIQIPENFILISNTSVSLYGVNLKFFFSDQIVFRVQGQGHYDGDLEKRLGMEQRVPVWLRRSGYRWRFCCCLYVLLCYLVCMWQEDDTTALFTCQLEMFLPWTSSSWQSTKVFEPLLRKAFWNAQKSIGLKRKAIVLKYSFQKYKKWCSDICAFSN